MKHMIEKAINRYLQLDPETNARLTKLEGKVVTIELRNTDISFQLQFQKHYIYVQEATTLEPDIIIQGTPLSLLHLSLTDKSKRRRFFSDDVLVTGNMELAQQVLAIFDELEIDWEEQASKILTDVPAYQLGRLVRLGKRKTKSTLKNVARYIDEYLHEEVLVVPPREALQDFFNEVDELQMDVDRLAARVARLEQLMESQ